MPKRLVAKEDLAWARTVCKASKGNSRDRWGLDEERLARSILAIDELDKRFPTQEQVIQSLKIHVS